MKHYILTLKQVATGYVRHRKVYWNTMQYEHYKNRLNEVISDFKILSIEPYEE